jgi:prepilin-type N-terminal cleavage/methylation domain-containing protein
MPNIPISVRHRDHSQRGFSLIEILVSTTLLVFLLMTATTMFMTFLVSNAKTNVRHVIKSEGTAALSRMEFLIRNAESLNANCAANGTTNNSITGKNFGESTDFTLNLTDDQLQYSAGATTELLTSSTTVASELNFRCFGTAGGNRRIEISFILASTADTINNPSTIISESFRSTVQIRN